MIETISIFAPAYYKKNRKRKSDLLHSIIILIRDSVFKDERNSLNGKVKSPENKK